MRQIFRLTVDEQNVTDFLRAAQEEQPGDVPTPLPPQHHAPALVDGGSIRTWRGRLVCSLPFLSARGVKQCQCIECLELQN
jgi:hypothetical protein